MNDRLELLQVAISAIDDAIEAVAALGKHSEADVNCLNDIRREYQCEYDELHQEIEAAEEAEENALIREWRLAV